MMYSRSTPRHSAINPQLHVGLHTSNSSSGFRRLTVKHETQPLLVSLDFVDVMHDFAFFEAVVCVIFCAILLPILDLTMLSCIN